MKLPINKLLSNSGMKHWNLTLLRCLILSQWPSSRNFEIKVRLWTRYYYVKTKQIPRLPSNSLFVIKNTILFFFNTSMESKRRVSASDRYTRSWVWVPPILVHKYVDCNADYQEVSRCCAKGESIARRRSLWLWNKVAPHKGHMSSKFSKTIKSNGLLFRRDFIRNL